MLRSVVFVGLAVSLAWVVGCGGADRPDLVSVTGQVTLNGQPLEGATVALQRDPPDEKYRRPSRAISDASGNFTPSTYGDTPGLPPGKYKVAVMKQEIPAGYDAENPAASEVNITWITPKVYSDMATSGLTVEITSSGMVPPVLALESTGGPQIENTRAPVQTNIP